MDWLTGPNVILALKIAVCLVTLLLAASLWALYRFQFVLHGRLNVAVFVLTLLAVIAFEVILRVVGVDVTAHMNRDDEWWLGVHLCFVVPLLPVMLAMLVTGLRHRSQAHVALSYLFGLLWAGMFVTGVFLLPHTPR